MGDTARELAVRNGFKKIAKLLAPSKGDTIKVSTSLTLKKNPGDIGFPALCVERIFACEERQTQLMNECQQLRICYEGV